MLSLNAYVLEPGRECETSGVPNVPPPESYYYRSEWQITFPIKRLTAQLLKPSPVTKQNFSGFKIIIDFT